MSLIFVTIAAILNAVMDILENEHYFDSIFKNKNQKFWYKRESWKYALMLGGYRFDAWHIAKSLMIVSMVAAIVFYESIIGIFDIVIFGFIWNVVFNLFYNKILK